MLFNERDDTEEDEINIILYNGRSGLDDEDEWWTENNVDFYYYT